MSSRSKRLLLAAAGAGLLAPAISAAPAAGAELNLAGINAYAAADQVTSITQFSDVRPTDWAYQALSNLIERYGCVAGYPDGTYRGGRAMTRFEAAALLNACLDRVTEVTDELRRLMAEFEQELAVLKGRVDGLEAKVGVLEAQQFSTTTKLRGEASFILGGVPDGISNPARAGKTTFNYDLRLNFDTSFSGKDLLRTRLRAGNFSNSAFQGIFALDKATNTSDSVNIDRLFYQFPVGDSLRFTVGALVRNTEMLSFRPWAYSSSILDVTNLGGMSNTYNKATGAGIGLSWRQQVEKGNPQLVFDLNYVANNGFNDSNVGAFSSDSGINVTSQLGVRGQNWGAAFAYRYGTENSSIRDANFNPSRVGSGQTTNSISIGGYWQPLESGFIPSISLGYGYTAGGDGFPDSNSWQVGLQWADVFADGNNFGVAFGQPPFASGNSATSFESWLLEVFYKAQVTDNISITPAIFYANEPLVNGGNNGWGGVIQTTFKF